MPHEEIPEATSFDSYTSLDKCISAANSVAMLLKGLNDRVENVPPMASYLTYIVGTVAINNGFSPNKHESQKADVAGRMYLHFLGVSSQCLSQCL